MKNTKLKAITLALLASAFMLENADPSPSRDLFKSCVNLLYGIE